jgi:hypothetical protein
LWWFEDCPCRPSSEDLPPSPIKLACPTAKQVSTAHHLLVFDGPPQALDEDVVSPGTFPIHANLDLVLEQQAGEGDAGELGALDALLFVKRHSRGVDFLATLCDEREDLSRKVAFQGSNGVEFGMPFCYSTGNVILGSLVGA